MTSEFYAPMKNKRRGSRVAGYALLVVSILAFIIYAYLLLNTDLGILILQLTVLAAIAALLAVLAWIGYTMATAPTHQQDC
jgi:predicted DNA-binding transcriptional regulator